MIEATDESNNGDQLKTVSGVIVSGSLVHWESILTQWCSYVDSFCTHAKPDRPWFHLEVPNAGILSAAAMACGHTSLVESDVGKAIGFGRSSKGRSDLWIQFAGSRSATELTEEFLELKKDAVEDGRIKLLQFERAILDARAVDWPCRAKIAACIFAIGSATSSSEVEQLGLIEEIRNKTGADAIAWVFPLAIRTSPADNKRFYPGAILALKFVGHQTTKEFSSHRDAGSSEI